MTTPIRLLALPCTVFLMLTFSGCGGGGSSSSNPVVDDTRDIDDPLINGCLSDTGIDLFAAEGDGVLGVTWNNNGDFDFSGGYQIRYGTATEVYPTTVPATTTSCAVKNCEFNIEGLTNDTIYHLVVDSLDGSNRITATSCELIAEPHILAFGADLQVNNAVETVAVTQRTPKIASAWNGAPLYMVWEENGSVVIARSDDFGATWGAAAPVLSGTTEAAPSLAFRRFVPEIDPVTGAPLVDPVTGEPLTDPVTGEPLIAIQPAMFIVLQSGADIVLVRADFPNGTDGAVVVGDPVVVGQGTLPVVAAVGDHIEVAFELNNTIVVASSIDGGQTFSTPQRVDNGDLVAGDVSSRPSLAIDPANHNVYIAYHGTRSSGDANIYLNVSISTSTEVGVNYQAAEIRIDDDTLGGGANQTNVSLAVDHRTGAVLATWEDRRLGADVYFSRSSDYGASWAANTQVGAGLAGDQTSPRAVADPGRNVYVVFIDSTNGQRPMFTRFNADGAFDPALDVSTAAGVAGAAAEEPAVSIDEYGNIYVVWTENRGGPDRDVFFALGR